MQPPDELPSDYDPRTRHWYKDAVSANRSTLTEPYLDAVTTDLIITIATPISRRDRQEAVAGGHLSLATLVKMIQAETYSALQRPTTASHGAIYKESCAPSYLDLQSSRSSHLWLHGSLKRSCTILRRRPRIPSCLGMHPSLPHASACCIWSLSLIRWLAHKRRMVKGC